MPTPGPDLSLLSISQLAIITGRDRRTITKLLAGMRPASAEGRAKLYEPPAALERIYLGQERLSVADEQARLHKARADAQEIRNARDRADLVPADATDRATIALATVVSARLQSLGARLAPALAAETTRARCQEIVDGAAEEALRELAESAEEARTRTNAGASGARAAGG